jgi:protocatechuate 3,4-dioxygenase beta subunit
MSMDRELSRRQVLAAGIVLGGGLVAAGPGWAAELLARTPRQTAGPFYPQERPLDADGDLTTVAGRPGQAQGQVLDLMGRVLDPHGEPVAGARVEIWQANAFGRYRHPWDSGTASLDPSFAGFGVQTTDTQGRYRFRTVKPAAYPASRGWTRTPHIHFQVIRGGESLVTQMYFPGEPLNESDFLFQAVGNQAAVTAALQPPTPDREAGSLRAIWDIVLA